MNFILAYVILVALGFIQGVTVDDPVLGKLTKDGRAAEAGLMQEITSCPLTARK